MSVSTSVVINAPIDEVWAEAADFASHVEWMADAESVAFLTDMRTGIGTTMSVRTRVGPLSTTDIIEVIDMEPPRRITVTHRGAVSGRGQFRLEEVGALKTRFWWHEDLEFPWFLGGSIGGVVATPILAAIWKRNLTRLKIRIEGTNP